MKKSRVVRKDYNDIKSFDGKRQKAIKRDKFQCVRCGMSDVKHKQKWNKGLTVDHKDRNRKNNCMKNLQTLCFSCHGIKDNPIKLYCKLCININREKFYKNNGGRRNYEIEWRKKTTEIKLCKKCWQMKNHRGGKCLYCEGKRFLKKEIKPKR